MTPSIWFYLAPFFTTAEGLSALVFLSLVVVTIVGGLIATNSQRLIRSVAGLAIWFVGVAGLYYYLNSFVAVMELLIYVGAVCVTIVFAVMLASPEVCPRIGANNALVGAASFGVGLVMFPVSPPWPEKPPGWRRPPR
jgi:NADH-quinone oxidoreductase subunit J